MTEPHEQIEQEWKPDTLRAHLVALENGVTWMAETIDELTASDEKLAADFAAYRAKYPPPDDAEG